MNRVCLMLILSTAGLAHVASGAVTIQSQTVELGYGGFFGPVDSLTYTGPENISRSITRNGPTTVGGFDPVTGFGVSWEANEQINLQVQTSQSGGVFTTNNQLSFARTQTQTPLNAVMPDDYVAAWSRTELRILVTEPTVISWAYSGLNLVWGNGLSYEVNTSVFNALQPGPFISFWSPANGSGSRLFAPGEYRIATRVNMFYDLRLNGPYFSGGAGAQLQVFIPTPGTALLVGAGVIALARRRR